MIESVRSKLCVAFASLALAASLAQQPLRGEDPAAKPDAKPAAKARAKPKGRLPANYAKVVDPTQREKIYKIQDSYSAKINALRAELQALEDKRDAEIEALLTPEQKQKLKALSAAKTSSSAGDDDDDAQPGAAADSKKDSKGPGEKGK